MSRGPAYRAVRGAPRTAYRTYRGTPHTAYRAPDHVFQLFQLQKVDESSVAFLLQETIVPRTAHVAGPRVPRTAPVAVLYRGKPRSQCFRGNDQVWSVESDELMAD